MQLDIILAKSISRFGRNSLEAQEYAHILKEYDVEVRFEREELSTFDPQAEMVFNFLTAVAEEESRSISENTKWTYKKLAEQGIRHLGNNRVLGYDEIDGVLTPNEQAWIPKLIFILYADGRPMREIIKILEISGAKRLRKDGPFNQFTIECILKNEIYVGDHRIQKAPLSDFKTKKPKMGEKYESFYVEEDHEGVVSRELWDAVQDRLEKERTRKDKGIIVNYNTHFLYGRLICGECGEYLTRKSYMRKAGTVKAWICKDRMKGSKGAGCKNLIISEEDLMENLTEALGLPWNGVENVNEKDFEILEAVKIFEDGRIEVKLNEQKKTA